MRYLINCDVGFEGCGYRIIFTVGNMGEGSSDGRNPRMGGRVPITHNQSNARKYV